MIKQILSASALSFALVSAAWALPAAPKADLPALNQSDIIQVGHGHGGKGKHYGGHKNYKHYNYKHYNKHYNYKHGRYTMVAAIGDAATTTVPRTGRPGAVSWSVRSGTARKL